MLTLKIKEEMGLKIHIQEDQLDFAKQNPERYEEFTAKIKSTLGESVVGGPFEELDMEETAAKFNVEQFAELAKQIK